MALEGIFEKIKELITGEPSDEEQRKRDVRPASEDPMGDPADDSNYQHDGRRYAQEDQDRNIAPASQDPLGDPADDIRPASEDPLGDPADADDSRGIRPASEDPLGDPADDRKYRV